jgi:hypothetical protein
MASASKGKLSRKWICSRVSVDSVAAGRDALEADYGGIAESVEALLAA